MLAPLPPADAGKVGLLRAQLPAVEAGIRLDTGSAGPLPAETVRAMRELEDYELRFGRGTPDAREELLGRMEEARAVVAALLRVDPAEVALTQSVADGLRTVVWTVDWRAGDEIVVVERMDPGAVAVLKSVRDRFGVRLRSAAIGGADEGDGEGDEYALRALEAAVSSRTRLVAVPHVTSGSGALLPVERIAELARHAGAWVAVDGSLAAGAVPIDLPSLGVDSYAIPAEKWLLGPEGMGALWASDRVVAEAPASGTSAGASRFDAPSCHGPSVAGFARSVGWLEMHVGLDWAYERSARLAAWTADALAGLPEVGVLTPRARMATIVTFRIAGWTAEEAARALARRHFALLRLLPSLQALEAGIAFFNTEGELARFVRGVAEVAANTPGSLPDRPELIVLPD